jgi:L-serine dehydratase
MEKWIRYEMNRHSILNDVIGPVMRGPSSSHTAGPFRIATIARQLFGQKPSSVKFIFDQDGSFAKVFRQQSSDAGFAAGLLDIPMTDPRFMKSLDEARKANLTVDFIVEPLRYSDHPNMVEIHLMSKISKLTLVGKSIGGGAFVITKLNDWDINITGLHYNFLIEIPESKVNEVRTILQTKKTTTAPIIEQKSNGIVLIHCMQLKPLPDDILAYLRSIPGILGLWISAPILEIIKGEPLFNDAKTLIAKAKHENKSLGQMGLEYESGLLGLDHKTILKEVNRRYDILVESINQGLSEEALKPVLIEPTARKIYLAESQGELFSGGYQTRAAIRAMAVAHSNAASGVICAAPTAGSAGSLPGVLSTLFEDLGISRDKVIMGLLAASAIGVIFVNRATFAAEVCGCQVEIGIASAMAAAAIVDIAGGTAEQACDAAAISLQNTMGSVCDLVAGLVEIPCHTRTAVGASSAFICADLIMGGYENPIPLDETIDASYESGRMLPAELRCTALGGLAQTPSALRLAKQLQNQISNRDI